MIKLIVSILAIILIFLFFINFVGKSKYVLLSFDTELIDSDDDINVLLNILEKYNATATFFVMGEFIEQRPALTRKIAKNHELACHSYSHPNFKQITKEKQEQELIKCKSLIQDITNQELLGFRAPYRSLTKDTMQLLNKLNFKYDASSFENIPFYFPKPMIKEIKSTSLLLIPTSDYVALKGLKFPKSLYFFILRNIKHKKLSFAFHPRLIMQYEKDFDSLLNKLSKKNKFISHNQFLSFQK